MKTYTTGTLVQLSGIFKNIAGTLVDPTTVTAKIILPDGTIDDLTSSVVKDSVGNYHVDYLVTTTGYYGYEWIGSGAVEVSGINQFNVNQATF